MSGGMRLVLFWVAALPGAVLAAMALAFLPAFGQTTPALGSAINATGVTSRHVTNLVTAVMFDYRALDTLIEESIFLAAVLGLMLILRGSRGESEDAPGSGRRHAPPSDAVTLATSCLFPLLILFAAYVILHAHLTPGGGFQGGAILGMALPIVYLGHGYQTWHRLNRPGLLEFVEGTAMAAFIALGLYALAKGSPFLTNWLPLGRTGSLFSGGFVPLLNIASGLAIGAGFSLALGEFLEETRQPQAGEEA